MATGVLASRKESSWGQSLGGFMGKIPYSSPQLNPNPNPNPNSKTKPKKKQFHTVNARHADESPAVTQTASDDAYSFNQRPIETISSPNGFNLCEYINFNVASYSRSELNDLRKRLVAELERIRSLNNRIESGQLQPRSNGKVKKLSGNKRPMPLGSVKDPKPDQKRICQTLDNGNFTGGGGDENGSSNLMKMCRQVLTKLMKHKHGWVFNTPVDAAALGLHDYHQIIKRPMDLGTVKSNMVKYLYSSPADFAADVRLTFNNAMLYNPKTDGVHIMAKELLDRFEDMFRPISQKFQSSSSGGKDNRHNFVADELQGSSWNDIPVPAPEPERERVKKPKPSPIPPNSSIVPPISKQNERLQNHSSVSNPQTSNPPSVQSPVRTPSPVRAEQQQQQAAKTFGSRGVTGKQPKPRAKDPNKREMSEEEKHKLGLGLQSLPQEKMPQLVQIIRKRNEHLAQEGDEIELDIEALDTETLWELDRFVTNWKKMVSKTKRQALMGNYSAAPTTTADEIPSSDRMDMAKRPKKGEAGEEDVDIGDEMEMPENSFPPLEIEKDDGGQVPGGPGHGNASSSSSSSSSSGSDSSSSSDSDSGSSSGSDSDADEAQS